MSQNFFRRVNVNELMKDIQELGIDLTIHDDDNKVDDSSQHSLPTADASQNNDAVQQSDVILETTIHNENNEAYEDEMIRPLRSTNLPIRDLSHYTNSSSNDDINSSDDEEQATDQDNDDDDIDDEQGETEDFNPYVPLNDINENLIDDEEFTDFVDSNSFYADQNIYTDKFIPSEIPIHANTEKTDSTSNDNISRHNQSNCTVSITPSIPPLSQGLTI